MTSRDEVEILLVEDDPRDVRLTLHTMQKENIRNQVEVVRDGEEALDFVFCRGTFSGRSPAHRPKLILLDLKLPKVDGMEVLRQIKSNADTQAIPVVILTSSKEERDLVEAYKLGANSYIQKAVDFDQFRETIKTAGFYWLAVNQLPPKRLSLPNDAVAQQTNLGESATARIAVELTGRSLKPADPTPETSRSDRSSNPEGWRDLCLASNG